MQRRVSPGKLVCIVLSLFRDPQWLLKMEAVYLHRIIDATSMRRGLNSLKLETVDILAEPLRGTMLHLPFPARVAVSKRGDQIIQIFMIIGHSERQLALELHLFDDKPSLQVLPLPWRRHQQLIRCIYVGLPRRDVLSGCHTTTPTLLLSGLRTLRRVEVIVILIPLIQYLLLLDLHDVHGFFGFLRIRLVENHPLIEGLLQYQVLNRGKEQIIGHEVEEKGYECDPEGDYECEPELPVVEHDLLEPQVNGLPVRNLVICDNQERGEEGQGSSIPEEEPPGPVSCEEACCDVVLEYYGEVGTYVLCPEVLIFTSWKDVVRISQLWYAIHEQ